MTEPVTKQELIDASEDAQTLEDVVNGDDATDVTSRLARTYPTLAKALRLIVQNGLLGATAFNLKSEMDGSGLVDDDYAVVTDDPTPANNGFYQKQSGTFEFLAWNPINQFLSALAAETSSRVAGDATNATAITTEATTRATADSDLQAAIDAEAVSRASTDTTLQANINAEAAARIAADNALSDLIDDEQSARIAGDDANSAAIAAETTERQTAISAEQSARTTEINSESTARQAADAAINAELDAETASRISADSSLQSQITAEAADRAAADATNAAAIATESTNRANADATLQNNINAEASTRTSADSAEQAARITADSALSDLIDDESTARIAADNTLQSNITAEVASRIAGDTANATAISTEQTDRIAADNTLQANIDAESATRSSADGVLTSAIATESSTRAAAISTEQAARITADDALQIGVAANATAIATETTDRIAADTAESSTRTEQVSLINATLSKIFGAVRFNGYRDDAGNRYLFAILGAGNKIGFGITSKLKMLWGGNQLVIDRVTGIKDSVGRYALVVTKTGRIYAPNLVLPAWVTATLTSLASQITAEISARIAADATLTAGQTTNTNAVNALAANFALSVNVTDDSGNKYLLALINRTSNRIAWGITRKGESVTTGAKHRGDRLPFAVLGKNGLAAISVSRTGKVRIPNLVLPSSLTTSIATLTTANVSRIAADIQMLPMVWHEINHVIWNGQSLSNGTQSTPIISTSQAYSNVMIASGVRLALTDSGYDGSALVPLIEVESGTLGETPVSGTVNGLVQRIVAAGGTAASRVMLGTASGIGSRRVDQLLDEANFYKIRNHVSEAKRLATAAGKTYAVSAICYAQGESDIGAGGTGNTSFSDYFRRYLQLMTNTRQVIVDASGQPFMPHAFVYQTSGHQNYNKQILHVPMAQWRASTQMDDVVMVVPSYRLPCSAVDNLHLTNEGSWLMGQYFARAMFWTFELGQKWRPLEPVDVAWSSTQIDVKYFVPCKPIQLSTAICTAVTNSGFDIWTASNTVISDAISSVTVLNDDTVRITLNPAATIPADAVLSYGRSRVGDAATSGALNNPACGNLIDSHGLYDTVTAPTTGTVYPLTNVGVLFRFRRNSGFH